MNTIAGMLGNGLLKKEKKQKQSLAQRATKILVALKEMCLSKCF